MAKKDQKKEAQTVDDIMNMINSKYGTKVMERASKAKSARGARLSSGIFTLDMELGGGWTKGRIHILKGEFSTGKTFVTTKTTASAQRHCRHCNTAFNSITQTVTDDSGEIVKQHTYGFDDMIPSYRPTDEQFDMGLDEDNFHTHYQYEGCECGAEEPHKCTFIDAEGTYHPEWAESQGIINDELNLIEPEFAEQAIDIVEALARTGMIDLLVVDSVPALTPSAEIEKSSEDNLVGTHARLMNRFMRVLQSALNSLGMDTEQKPVILLINQIRLKVGVMFGNPETSPGGKGLDFTASTIVKMLSSQRTLINTGTGKIVEKTGANVKPAGATLNFNIPKNKTYRPFGEGKFKIDTDNYPEHGYKKGKVNNEEQIIEYAAEMGVVTTSGSWYSYITQDGEEIKGQGAPKFTEAILEHEGLFKIIDKQTREALKRRG